MGAVFALIFALIFALYSAWYFLIPNPHYYVQYIVKSTPAAYATVPAIIIVADMVEHLHKVDIVTGNFLDVFDDWDDTGQAKLNELFNMHQRLSDAISEAYKEINNNIHTERPITNRLNARQVLINPIVNDLNVKHNLIIDNILLYHKHGITTDESYDGDKLITHMETFRKAFRSRKYRAGEYLKTLTNEGY